MRYLVLSDIHGNLEAFQAVLADAERRSYETIWCLGDVVGYGPNPNECIALLSQFRNNCVIGNHDAASAGILDTSLFNLDAALACSWTAAELTPFNSEYLRKLPSVLRIGDATLTHGSPREPNWEYVHTARIAEANFARFSTRLCLVGHTHVPLIYASDEPTAKCFRESFDNGLFEMISDRRYIVNPGSVGQPRDADPRAAYGIYDAECGTIEHHRIPYDVAITQGKMAEIGLPARLIDRLSLGL